MTKTTILVESRTRERLRHIARKNQTYDDLINELMNLKRNRGSFDGGFGGLQSSETIMSQEPRSYD